MPGIQELLAAETPSAGGAEITQVAIVTVAVSAVVAALVLVGMRQRTRPLRLVRLAESWSERLGGLPGWAGVPAAVAAVSLAPCLLGLIWDESLHIDDGRDDGPLANPSHYLLLLGLLGGLAAGWLAVVLPHRGDRPGPAAVRITRDWHAPAGGVLITVASSFSLVGFPLDDVSHRLFGQDVTLWGTTHLWMMAGPVISVLGIVILVAEGRAAMPGRRRASGSVSPLRARAIQTGLASGGLLAALTIFQGEFDYGVPQFRLLYHPVTIAGAAAIALVAARSIGGRGALVTAVGFYLVLRGAYTVLVGPVAGQSVAHFPLYAAEAALVELAALLVAARDRPLRFGLLSGGLIGTAGVLAEWGWSHVWMPIPWPGHLVPEALAVTLPAALACGLLGGFVAAGVQRRAELMGERRVHVAAVAAVAVLGITLAALRPTGAPDARAVVALEEVRPAPEREVVATVRFEPPGVVRDAAWLRTISYQGGVRLRTDELREVAPGVWRTAPMPVHGTWKSAIRLHRGGDMAAVPVFLPADPAIPAAEVPAPARFERPLIEEKRILQREAKEGVAGWTVLTAQLIVLLAVLGLIGLAGWCLVRLGTARDVPAPAPPPTTPAASRVPARA